MEDLTTCTIAGLHADLEKYETEMAEIISLAHKGYAFFEGESIEAQLTERELKTNAIHAELEKRKGTL